MKFKPQISILRLYLRGTTLPTVCIFYTDCWVFISAPAKSLNLSIKNHLLDKLSDLKIKLKIVIFQLSVITWQNSSTLFQKVRTVYRCRTWMSCVYELVLIPCLRFNQRKEECNKCRRLLRGTHLLPKQFIWYSKWSWTIECICCWSQVRSYKACVDLWPADRHERGSVSWRRNDTTDPKSSEAFFTSESIASAATTTTTTKKKTERKKKNRDRIYIYDLMWKTSAKYIFIYKKTIYVHLKFSFSCHNIIIN